MTIGNMQFNNNTACHQDKKFTWLTKGNLMRNIYEIYTYSIKYV